MGFNPSVYKYIGPFLSVGVVYPVLPKMLNDLQCDLLLLGCTYHKTDNIYYYKHYDVPHIVLFKSPMNGNSWYLDAMLLTKLLNQEELNGEPSVIQTSESNC